MWRRPCWTRIRTASATLDDIIKLSEQSRAAHLDVADLLFGLLRPTVDKVTSADLKALGVDDAAPNNLDYEIDCWWRGC